VSSYWKDVKAIAREVWEMFQDPEHPFDEESSQSREGETWMMVSNSKWIASKRKWQEVLGLSKNVPGIGQVLVQKLIVLQFTGYLLDMIRPLDR